MAICMCQELLELEESGNGIGKPFRIWVVGSYSVELSCASGPEVS